MPCYAKTLSANDVGATGSHMAGIAIPKGNLGLLDMLPKLDPLIYNPSAEILCETDSGEILRLRFIHYNNSMHSPSGTRNEYRLTHLTRFLKDANAKTGDTFEISRADDKSHYRIRIIPIDQKPALGAPRHQQPTIQVVTDSAHEQPVAPQAAVAPVRIKITSEWRQVN